MPDKKEPNRRYHKGALVRKVQVIYQDRDLIVVNKPAGMLSVPIPRMQSLNLLEFLQGQLAASREKAITVHRIDRYTSGLVVFAKNSKSHKHLVKQFLAHTPVRTYLALVRGRVKDDSGTLEHYLKKVDRGFRNVVVKNEKEGGAMARLHYRVAEHFPDTTLVHINLDTGLKNQIRVQFEAIGHPMVGDRHYHAREADEPLIDRQALHALELTFDHPSTGNKVMFRAPVPGDIQNLINWYRKNRKADESGG
jgi:23S rRNA pseudouridine1911/1915/1917 synthase